MRKLNKFTIPVIAVLFFVTACSTSKSDSDISDQGDQNNDVAEEQNDESFTQDGDSSTGIGDVEVPEFNIVTLLPMDAIPAIDDPQYYDVETANAEYSDDEQVIGIVFNGEARAYSTGLLSSHEIVNDTVGGRKIAVTW